MEKWTLSPACCESLKLSDNPMACLEENIVHAGVKWEKPSIRHYKRKSSLFINQGIILGTFIIMFWIHFPVNCGQDLFIIRNILKSGKVEKWTWPLSCEDTQSDISFSTSSMKLYRIRNGWGGTQHVLQIMRKQRRWANQNYIFWGRKKHKCALNRNVKRGSLRQRAADNTEQEGWLFKQISLLYHLSRAALRITLQVYSMGMCLCVCEQEWDVCTCTTETEMFSWLFQLHALLCKCANNFTYLSHVWITFTTRA